MDLDLVSEDFDKDFPPVTDLQEIFELDGKTINDILAIYMSKRSGSKNWNGRRWSPSAACLIAALMTKVPEHFVQQIIAHWEENGPSNPCFTYANLNKVDFVKYAFGLSSSVVICTDEPESSNY